jgi:hypothetical protein
METNNIRNYDEITNTGIKPSTKYIEKIVPIRTEEDKDACLRFLTLNNNSDALCHGFYDTNHINRIIEYCEYLLYFSTQEHQHEIIAFALLHSKRINKGKLLEISLACAIPNKHKFGNMIAHSIYKFAVRNKIKFLSVAPRTPELRKTFIKYGFESVYGKELEDEVLLKEIDLKIPVFLTRNKTKKVKRKIPTTPTYDFVDSNV